MANMRRTFGGIIYWYLFTVLIPHWRGYRLEDAEHVLDHGTSVPRLFKVKDQ